ncbi:hypothetical protein FB382_000774 [Nocardioides ginsengisegetis]|uniref:BNR repeat-like domain-containing protein n=1 Tax=Nocardioides ginsengisegetis TaxID=661491 RepID=A0A7W3P8I5_9ACTN|nr:hypothetical protein [Nocardioides ginsengisegetis]MBA8802483.1 hypothetical protein [Nocardioides ginsengisegetis]
MSTRARAFRSLAVVATAVALAMSSPAAYSSRDRATPPPISRLGTAPSGYTMGDPQVLRTRDGVTLVAWDEYYQSPNHLRLARKVGANAWQRVPVPVGDLTSISPPYLIEDTVGDRVIMAANGQGETDGSLGTYVWTSANNGRTWSDPQMVWDSFGSGNLTPDGSGGFYAVSDLTGVSVVHVPSALTMQHWPDDDLVLSDRIASRGALDLATIGRHNTLLFGFADGHNQAWVHVTATPGNDRDVRVMRGLYADGALKLAADRTGGVAVAIREVHTPAGNVNRLFAVAFQIDGNALVLRTLRPISSLGEDVVNFGVTTLKTATGGSTGRFRIAWRNDADRLRTRQSSQPSDPVWGTTRTIVTFPARGYVYPATPALDGAWTSLHAYTKDLHEVEIAVPLG